MSKIQTENSSELRPLFLVKTKNNDGLVSKKDIKEGALIRLYYAIAFQLEEIIANSDSTGKPQIDVILNEQKKFDKDDYVDVVKVIMRVAAHLNAQLRIFDEKSASRRKII